MNEIYSVGPDTPAFTLGSCSPTLVCPEFPVCCSELDFLSDHFREELWARIRLQEGTQSREALWLGVYVGHSLQVRVLIFKSMNLCLSILF